MVVDQVWDDKTFEEPLEARKQRKPLTSHAAVVKSTAPAQASSAIPVSSKVSSTVTTHIAVAPSGLHSRCKGIKHTEVQGTATLCREGRGRAGVLRAGLIGLHDTSRTGQSASSQHAGCCVFMSKKLGIVGIATQALLSAACLDNCSHKVVYCRQNWQSSSRNSSSCKHSARYQWSACSLCKSPRQIALQP